MLQPSEPIREGFADELASRPRRSRAARRGGNYVLTLKVVPQPLFNARHCVSHQSRDEVHAFRPLILEIENEIRYVVVLPRTLGKIRQNKKVVTLPRGQNAAAYRLLVVFWSTDHSRLRYFRYNCPLRTGAPVLERTN